MRRAVCTALSGCAAAAALAVVLGGCGGNSSALGHQACVDVTHSLRLFDSARTAASPAAAATDRAKALDELRDAVQPAALAASSDGTWQALEATLSESSRVPESYLVPALSAQCAGVVPGG